MVARLGESPPCSQWQMAVRLVKSLGSRRAVRRCLLRGARRSVQNDVPRPCKPTSEQFHDIVHSIRLSPSSYVIEGTFLSEGRVVEFHLPKGFCQNGAVDSSRGQSACAFCVVSTAEIIRKCGASMAGPRTPRCLNVHFIRSRYMLDYFPAGTTPKLPDLLRDAFARGLRAGVLCHAQAGPKNKMWSIEGAIERLGIDWMLIDWMVFHLPFKESFPINIYEILNTEELAKQQYVFVILGFRSAAFLLVCEMLTQMIVLIDSHGLHDEGGFLMGATFSCLDDFASRIASLYLPLEAQFRFASQTYVLSVIGPSTDAPKKAGKIFER